MPSCPTLHDLASTNEGRYGWIAYSLDRLGGGFLLSGSLLVVGGWVGGWGVVCGLVMYRLVFQLAGVGRPRGIEPAPGQRAELTAPADQLCTTLRTTIQPALELNATHY